MPDVDTEIADAEDQTVDAEDASSTFDAVEAKMAEMRGDEPETKDEDVAPIEPTETEDTDSDKSENDDSDKSEDDSTILPVGHRRAALASGWSNEEVDHFIETRPDEAVAEFKDVFEARRKESSEWSTRGRQLAAAGKDTDVSETATEAGKGTALDHYDVKALIEEHPGNEDLINALVTPLNATIDRVNAVTEKLTKSEDFVRGTEEQAVAAATQEFLMSDGMKSFRDTYGGEVKDLTDKQQASRMELFKQADIIATGAQDHGYGITIPEALDRAHTILSQGTRDEAIRQGIRDDMKKRTKTTPSSHKRTPVSDKDGDYSDEELEARVQANMDRIRNK